MGVLIVAGVSVVAVAFMTVFFVAICRESSRMKVYRLVSTNSKSMTAVADARVVVGKHMSIDGTGTVLSSSTEPDKVRRSMHSQGRKAA